MTNREIKKILLKIKKEKKLTITDVCEYADIGRSNFTVFLNSETEKDASDTTMLKLTEAYPEYFNSKENLTAFHV